MKNEKKVLKMIVEKQCNQYLYQSICDEKKLKEAFIMAISFNDEGIDLLLRITKELNEIFKK